MHSTRVLSAITLAVGLAVGALGGAAAFAQGAKESARVEASARLTIVQVLDRVTALGYKGVDGIEREKDVFEVEARTAAGERVKLYVDARSGEVLRTKSDARDRSRDSERAVKDADRGAPDCSERRCRDGGQAQAPALPREAVGWYLSDIYGRMKAAGI